MFPIADIYSNQLDCLEVKVSEPTQQNKSTEPGAVTQLYIEHADWEVNTGGKTIHAKRMPGLFRTIKYITESFWLILFLGPYLRWNGHQAMMLDVNSRQFRFFSLTVLPQDIWMVSLLLLLMAMVLFAVTSVASRVFCGYFCFQTAWVDLFTWIEGKIEGTPNQRHKMDAAPWDSNKIIKKTIKHFLWMVISLLTGISVIIWFTDALEFWHDLFTFNLSLIQWATLTAFFFGTYILAGFLREQVCLWLCPYARIQGVMADAQTLFPTYDEKRGEPRGKARRNVAGNEHLGDCIDCYQCVQVCPTGVDIRLGQQLGCITCGLCLDACDSVMDKIGRQRGLIRYMSQDEVQGKPVKKLHQHPRTWVYVGILLVALSGIIYGLTHLGALTLRATPERQPLFVRMSDGQIQNKYSIRVLNKTGKDVNVRLTAEGGTPGMQVVEGAKVHEVHHGRAQVFTLFIKAPESELKQEVMPLKLRVVNIEDPNMTADYDTIFNAPKH